MRTLSEAEAGEGVATAAAATEAEVDAPIDRPGTPDLPDATEADVSPEGSPAAATVAAAGPPTFYLLRVIDARFHDSRKDLAVPHTAISRYRREFNKELLRKLLRMVTQRCGPGNRYMEVKDPWRSQFGLSADLPPEAVAAPAATSATAAGTAATKSKRKIPWVCHGLEEAAHLGVKTAEGGEERTKKARGDATVTTLPDAAAGLPPKRRFSALLYY